MYVCIVVEDLLRPLRTELLHLRLSLSLLLDSSAAARLSLLAGLTCFGRLSPMFLLILYVVVCVCVIVIMIIIVVV